MGNNQNFIELNGNRYDAVTGKLLKAETQPGIVEPSYRTSPSHHTAPKELDGFKARPAHPHATTAHAVHHKTERSKTLMRHVVKKPVPVHSVKSGSNPTHTPKPVHHISGTHELLALNISRIKRASQVPKSTLVSRFGIAKRGGHTKHVSDLPVRPAPPQSEALHQVSTPITRKVEQNPFDAINPFDMALQDATSHQQKKTKLPSLGRRAAKKLRVSPRTFNVGSGLVVAMLIGGFVAYKSIPQFALHLASARAGIRASMPDYQPAGFSLSGPVQYSSGQITLNFQSNSDDRGFRVVQKSSEWSSQTLLENFVSSQEPYQTFQDRGRTVYIYDGSNATWVNGGVWYQIEGESALNSDQLLRIASSL